uniref:Small ribosomal subunit protein eS31 domain-containing protein n=1 Tax=Ananas comosus var. bracteatus TaxID=296719 RepID=A0A6V7P5E5_ANACO|nr:unnamed protein product [Ananas comosus var. bracteatus]
MRVRGEECPNTDCGGAGMFMANHFDRHYCRKCTITFVYQNKAGSLNFQAEILPLQAQIIRSALKHAATGICCSANPKVTRALSRKDSNRMERWGGEEQETDDASKRLIVKGMPLWAMVPLQLELLKLPSMLNKAILAAQSAATSPILTDSGEGRSRRFSRFAAMHPRKILLIFATLVTVYLLELALSDLGHRTPVHRSSCGLLSIIES